MNYAIYKKRVIPTNDLIGPLAYPERLVLSEQMIAPKPKVRPHHFILAGIFMPVVYVAERCVHFLEVPAELIWAVKVIIFKEL